MNNDNRMSMHIMSTDNKVYIWRKNDNLLKLSMYLDKLLRYEVENAWAVKRNSNWDGIYKFYNLSKRCFDIGFIERVKRIATKLYPGVEFDISDGRKQLDYKFETPDRLNTLFELTESQMTGVEQALKYKVCCLEYATSSGKTVMMSEIIRRTGFKTLVICHTVLLAKQLQKEISNFLGVEVGMIGNGKMDIKDITVGIRSSLAKKKDELKHFYSEVNMVLFDEAHHAHSKENQDIINKCKYARYKIGVSGTLHIHQKMLIEKNLGPIVASLSSDELYKEGRITKIRPVFIDMPSAFYRGQENYLLSREENIVLNGYRNNTCAKIVNKHKGNSVLILVNEIEHGEELLKVIPDAKFIWSKQKERDEIFQDFVDRKFDVLIGQIAIFCEGISVNHIEIIINAQAGASYVRVNQVKGRGMRKHKDKDECVMYDFIDKDKYLLKQSKKRIKILENEKLEVEKLDFDEL